MGRAPDTPAGAESSQRMRPQVNRYLGLDGRVLASKRSFWTAREICQQPRVWREAHSRINEAWPTIDPWLAPRLATPNLRILLCGAGTSAYIGDTVAAWLRKHYREPAVFQIVSVSTTDLAADPAQHLSRDIPTLMISFARSGDSPESVACIKLANQLLSNCHHLILTCNPEGRLAAHAQGDEETVCLTMPEETNDRSFAMTSSYTAMLVSCLTLFTPNPGQLEQAAQWAEQLLNSGAGSIADLAQRDFLRLVVLGAGCLLGTAREAALKCLELTAGRVVAIHDSPLGFRHGPKIVIDDSTLVVHLRSSDPHTSLYDEDLLAELRYENRCAAIVELSPASLAGKPRPREAGTSPLRDAWLSLVYSVYCQMLAFYKAIALGVAADSPCPSGEVNRVVNGVTIHPFKPHRNLRLGA